MKNLHCFKVSRLFLIGLFINVFLLIENEAYSQFLNCGPVDYYHAKVLDKDLHLDSWRIDENGPFEYIINLSANWWKISPYVAGWPIWCTAAVVDREYNQSNGALPGSAGAFSIISCLKYYAYTGDSVYRNLAIKTGDYILNNDLTPSWYRTYPSFPYAVGTVGNITPDGSGHPSIFSLINPAGHIQPDKGAMIGVALLELYKVTDSLKYLNSAINIANCLSDNALDGDDVSSPWPMRVMADDGTLVDGLFSANVSYACRLFDELLRIGKTGNGKYRNTRDSVWSWLKTYVIPYDDASRWRNFFEDHGGGEVNPSQLNALETVRYLIEKRKDADADWFYLSGKIIDQVKKRWALSQLDNQGYICIAEQESDKSPYNSHTARFGSILAMYYEAGGSSEYMDIAYHSLCYGIYSVENDGFTNTYFSSGTGAWTTDSFGDFLGHYMDAIAAIPEWAGNGTHILKSSSTIKNVSYSDNLAISYSTFDNFGNDKLKIPAMPTSVKVDGSTVFTYVWDKTNKVLELNRTTGSNVIITLPDSTRSSETEVYEIITSIYPNPVKDELKIILRPGFENSDFAIYYIDGRLAMEGKLLSIENTLNVSSLSKGMYILLISDKSKSTERKIIKL